MQCVILAAGKGTRLRPLTNATPKPLVKVAGKPLLDHIVGALPDDITELIIVTGYLEDQIKSYCGEKYFGRTVTYVHQEEQKGTGHALWLCKNIIAGRFLFLFGDDIHGRDDIAQAVAYDRSLLATKSDTPERFGVVHKKSDNTLAKIVEKPQKPLSDLVSTGVMVLDKHIFDYELSVAPNGEYYLTDVIAEYAKDHPVMVVEQKRWIPIGYSEDITRAEKILAEQSG